MLIPPGWLLSILLCAASVSPRDGLVLAGRGVRLIPLQGLGGFALFTLPRLQALPAPRRRKTDPAGSVGGNNKPKGAELGRERPGRSRGEPAPRPLRAAPIPPAFYTFPSPPSFFFPRSPPFLFFLPLIFPSPFPPSLPSLSPWRGWISLLAFPAAASPEQLSGLGPARSALAAAGGALGGPTRVPVPSHACPHPTRVPSQACPGHAAAAAGRAVLSQVRHTGHPPSFPPSSPKPSSLKYPIGANTTPSPRPELFQ